MRYRRCISVRSFPFSRCSKIIVWNSSTILSPTALQSHLFSIPMHKLYSSIFWRSSFNWSNYRRSWFVVPLTTLVVTLTCPFYCDPVWNESTCNFYKRPKVPLSHAFIDFKNNNDLLVSNTDWSSVDSWVNRRSNSWSLTPTLSDF